MTLLFRQIRRNEKRQGDRSTENIRLHLRGLPQNRYFIRGFALSVCVRLFFPVVFRGQPKWSTSNWIFPQYHNAGSDVFTTAFKSSKSWISGIFGPQSKTLHSRFEGSLKVVADFAFNTDFSVKFSNQMSNYSRPSDGGRARRIRCTRGSDRYQPGLPTPRNCWHNSVPGGFRRRCEACNGSSPRRCAP